MNVKMKVADIQNNTETKEIPKKRTRTKKEQEK